MAHDVIKAEKIAAAAAVQLNDTLTLPQFMQKETFDNYKGALDDTVNVKVEGVLPWHDYTWRQDAKDRVDIEFDEYKERKYGVKLGANIYSGVQLTDEQSELDLMGWSKLTAKQTEAVGSGLNYKAADYVQDDANYDVTMGIGDEVLFSGLIKLRQNLRALHSPGATYTLAIGANWEAALLNDPRLNLAQNVGDSIASEAVTNATLGRKLGFNFLVVPELDPDAAIAFGDGAFVFANAAPAVPQSAPFGATGSYQGTSLRIIRHYNHRRFIDESVVNSWYGFRVVRDVLAARVNNTDNFRTVSSKEHQVRAIKLTLNGTGAFTSTVTGAATELKSLTKLTDADLTVANPVEEPAA